MIYNNNCQQGVDENKKNIKDQKEILKMTNQMNNQKKIKGIGVNLMEGNVTLNFTKIIRPEYYNKQTKSYVAVEPENIATEVANGRNIKYSSMALIPKDSKGGKELKKAIDTLWEMHELDNKCHNPLKDGDVLAKALRAQDKNGDRLEGMWQFNIGGTMRPNSNMKDPMCPKIFDKKGVYNAKKDKELEGHFCNAMLYVKYFDGGKSGITIYINGLQILDINPAYSFNTPENTFKFEEPDNKTTQDATAAAFGLKVEVPESGNMVGTDGVPLTDDDDDEPPFE